MLDQTRCFFKDVCRIKSHETDPTESGVSDFVVLIRDSFGPKMFVHHVRGQNQRVAGS